MSRYKKYIDIIDKLDKALEEKGLRLLEGTVTPDNLATMEKILCVMHKAWQVAWEVDRLDDISRAMSAIARRGEGPDAEAVRALGNDGGEARQGRDFRPGYHDPGFAARAFGNLAPGFWPAEAAPAGPMTDPAMSRRGRRMIDIEQERERDFVMLPGLGFPWQARRMGYDADPYGNEDNAPYNRDGNAPAGNAGASNGGTGGAPVNNRARGLVHAPVQSAGAPGSQPATA